MCTYMIPGPGALVDELHGSFRESRQIISAPMAGRIFCFQVDQGDMVKDGDGLIVLETMKMENELKSKGIGRKKEIMVAENDVVTPRQQLMIIEYLVQILFMVVMFENCKICS